MPPFIGSALPDGASEECSCGCDDPVTAYDVNTRHGSFHFGTRTTAGVKQLYFAKWGCWPKYAKAQSDKDIVERRLKKIPEEFLTCELGTNVAGCTRPATWHWVDGLKQLFEKLDKLYLDEQRKLWKDIEENPALLVY